MEEAEERWKELHEQHKQELLAVKVFAVCVWGEESDRASQTQHTKDIQALMAERSQHLERLNQYVPLIATRGSELLTE